MARRTLDGSMDFRPRRTSKRLRDLPFPKNVRTSRATGTVRRARLGRQPLQAVRQRRAGFGRPGPRRRIQLELRNSRSGPVAETRQKYAGSRRMELRGNETGRPGQLQPDRVDRTGQHSGRRGRQYERQLAVQPQRLLQTAPGARLRLLCRRTGRAGRRGRLPLGLGNARIRRLGMEQSAGRHDRRSQRSARLSGTPAGAYADPADGKPYRAFRRSAAERRRAYSGRISRPGR